MMMRRMQRSKMVMSDSLQNMVRVPVGVRCQKYAKGSEDWGVVIFRIKDT